MRNRIAGFTLIELMVVVAIVAILATVALPAFQTQMRKSRRAEAISTLQDVQLRAERWRVDHADWSAFSPSTPTSANYTFEFSSASSSEYSITATATGNQAKDTCGDLTISSTDGVVERESSKGDGCW